MVATPKPWTEEDNEILRKALADGLSAREISLHRLPERTRSAIQGRVHRYPDLYPVKFALALSPEEREHRRRVRTGEGKPRKKIAPPRKTLRKAGRLEVVAFGSWSRPGPPKGLPKAGAIPKRPAAIPEMAGDFKSLELHELDRNQCRFPHGDGPFTFCGQEVEKGGSYCPHHAALCYRKVESRMDKAA